MSHICNKGNKLPKCHTIAIKKKVTKMSHNCNQKTKQKNLQGWHCIEVNPYSAFQREVFINSYH